MRYLTCLAFLAAVSCRAAPLDLDMHVDVQGTEFIVTLPDGKQRRSSALIGAIMQMPDGHRMRIDAVERETSPQGDEIWLHTLSVQTDAGWSPLCEPDSNQRALGFPFQGTFTESGRYIPTPGLFSVSCTSGAQAKCIRFGYAPWKHGPDGGSLSNHYSACVRMVRADYCGDNKPHTVNGTMIDIYDDIKVQESDQTMTDLRFEAGWAPDGAVCVHHLRIPSLPDPRPPGASCPGLRSQASEGACTEAWARSHGALLYNRSR